MFPFVSFSFIQLNPSFFFLGRAVGFHVAISYIKEGIETEVTIVRGGTKGVAMVEVAYVPILTFGWRYAGAYPEIGSIGPNIKWKFNLRGIVQ